MIRVYQILHSGVDLDPNFFFQRDRNSRTRGHPYKLVKPRAATRVRRNAFAIRIINDWNSLPTEVVSAPSTNTFKARLDSHWSGLKYTIPDTD